MAAALIEQLQTVQVTDGGEAGGLQVFGLRWERGPGPDYTTLDDGLAQGLLEVTEVSDGGTVPTLKVANKGDRLAFLMAGEQLAGGKQNRVLNASILVDAHSELPIPVSCVERGRWGYRAPKFGSAGTASHSQLRKLMHRHATIGYRSVGTPTSRQMEVWKEVDRKLGESGSISDTQMLQTAFEDTEPLLTSVVEQLALPEGASGVAFAYGGRLVGFDLFDKPETLARLWPKLVRAYASDARVAPREEVKAITPDDVAAWLRSAVQAKEETFKSPGVGNDVRLEGARLIGAGLVVGEHPVHVEVFASDGPAA
jgi:hypothetical protein